jgi:hypothetical protein
MVPIIKCLRGTFKIMGSLFKMPKYEPPKQVAENNKLLDEREARADANEKREKRKLASRSRSRRTQSRLLFSDERNNPSLGVTNNMTPSDSYDRNPMDTGSRYT